MKKGQLMGSVVTVVTVAILLFISLLLVNKVRSNLDGSVFNSTYNETDGTGRLADQDTYDEIGENTSTAFSLTAIAMIVLVAFLIITILRG